MSGCHVPTETLEEKLERLEDNFKEIKLIYSNPLQQEIWQKNMLERLEKLEQHFSGDYQLVAKKVTPHKCPLCEGSGVDLLSIHPELKKCNCRGCEGKGILWG